MSLYAEALQQFRKIFAQAQQLELTYPNAMTLATSDAKGRPDARVVLLKELDDRGFVFYTNQRSTKAQALRDNPQATLLFYWESLQRQIRVHGTIETVTAAEADAYWLTRPLESRIGGWASHQSQVLERRIDLENRFKMIENQYDDGNIPRPPHWSGYRLLPDYFEFWEERPFRLHNRLCYEKRGEAWQKFLLNP
jgi:pyridoxamine 5'-phosphate oxidase